MEYTPEMMQRLTGRVKAVAGPQLNISILNETSFVNRTSYDWRLHNAIGFVKD